MSERIKDDFTGTGNMTDFTAEMMKVVKCLNDAEVFLQGDQGTAKFDLQGNRLILDLTGLKTGTGEESTEGDGLPSTEGKSEEMILKLELSDPEEPTSALVADWGFLRLIDYSTP